MSRAEYLLLVGAFWVYARRMPPEQAIELVRIAPKIFVPRLGAERFREVLESTV